MTEWDLIESGYNAADETINFGTRILADCENLYETCTIATIKHSTEAITCDKVTTNSIIKDGKLYFSINKVFNVFETLQCSNVEFEMTFDEIVDCFCVLPEFKLLFVCLRDGSFYVFSITDATDTVFVGSVVENTLLEESFFIHCYPEIKENNVKLWVVTKTGRLYSLIIKDLFKKSEVEESNKQFELVAHFDHSVTYSAFSYPYLFVCGEQISTFDVESQDIVSEDECSMKKISAVDKLLIGLQENGTLSYICSETLILSEIITEALYKDFVSIPNSYHILAITQPTQHKSSQIQLINCIGFDIIFSLNLPHEIFLIQPENVHDETIYITRIQHEENVKELRFTSVYETSPEARLSKLLKKHRLDEAETFVKLFNLDENVVKKARAQAIVDKNLCSKVDIDGLLGLLEEMKDLQFSLQCVCDVHSCCERLVDVKRVLEHGCCEFPDGLQSNLDICAMYATISDLLFRFHTYVALLNNRGEEYDSNVWFEFSGCDLIEEIIISLQKYKLQESAIIYSRLDRKTIENNLTEKIQDILNTLDKLQIMDLEPFLHVFIPVSLNLQPATFSIFVKWLCAKILQIQQTNSQDFPENAITFACMITEMLRIETDTDISREINELTVLQDGLKQLKILRDDFRIIVPLQDYLEGPKHFIRTLLNLNFDMEGQDYGNFLKNYLYKYMLDNSLVPDDIFLEEIDNLVQYEEKYWIEIVPYILNCINSLEKKLKAVINLMDVAQVPWSKTLSEIFSNCLHYTHPLVSEIRKQIENYPSRSVCHKYGFLYSYRTPFSLSFRVERIIFENRTTMLEDLKQLCTTREDVETVNKTLVLHYLEIGDLAQAIETLQNNSKDIKLFLCKHFIGFIKNIINNEFVSRDFQKNCIEFLRPVCNELKKLSDASSISESHEQIIRNTYSINKTFGRKIKTHHLQIRKHKKALQDDLICDVVQEFQDGTLDVIKSLDMIATISKYLDCDGNDLLVELCTKLENFTLIQNAAEKMYTSPTNSKSLSLMAILLLKHVGTSPRSANATITDLNETFLPECSKIDLKVFMNAYQLAECIAARAILKADHNDLDVCCEVLNWVQSTYFMVCKEMESVRQEIYRGSFGCDLVLPSYNSFHCVKNVFNLYVDYIRNYSEPNTRYLTYFNHGNSLLTEEQLQQQISFLPQTVADLSTQGQTLTAFKLFLTFRTSLIYATKLPPTCLETLNNIILNQCVPQLLQKVMSTRYFDSDLAYDLFMLMDPKRVVKYIQQTLVLYKVDVVKFEAVARLSHRILGYYKDRAKQEKIMSIILTCKWWKKLKGACPISYVDFFKSNVNELVEKLIQFKCLKGGLLEEFADDFKLDLQTLLILQLKSTLIFWKPSYNIKTDVNGKRKLVMGGGENDLFGECEEIVAKIVDTERLHEIINSLWHQINFYYYEVFTAVLRLLEDLRKNADDGKRSLMLVFLKDYNRFSSPSEAEKGEWFTAFPDTQNLDPLSEFRLPFTVTFFTSDVWNLIRPEISLQTYKCWFEAVDILKGNLSKDEICCFVVKQVVANGLLLNGSNKEWVMYPKHEDLFKEIDLCVQQISDLKMATATVYHLMTHTPQGADLVKAATLCFQYALKYKENHPDASDVQRNFIKVQKQYLSYSAMHILHLNQLAEDRYLKMVSDPNELIDALYMDERIIKKLNSVVLNFPDINKTVEDLAELYQISIHQKRLALLNNWLANSSTEVSLNTTIQFIPSYEADLDTDVTADNIKRAAYLCSGKEIESWRDYLAKKGLCDTPPDCKNYIYRARALTCFCMITDSTTSFDITGISKNVLMNFIAKLTLINDLQYQGYNFDVETLDAANKKEILIHLSQNIGSSSNVKIMGALCMTYNISTLKYWKVIIKSANRLNLLKELKEYIAFLKPLAYCHHNQFYIDAWQRVIDSTVTAQTCVEALRTIQNCPVLYSLKFNHLVEKFINIKRPECAALLLQYLDEKERDAFGEIIVKENDGVIESVESLSNYGIWGINQVRAHLLSLSL